MKVYMNKYWAICAPETGKVFTHPHSGQLDIFETREKAEEALIDSVDAYENAQVLRKITLLTKDLCS